MSLFNLFLCYGYLDHRDLPVLSHSFPTRRSSDLSFWRRRQRREQQDQVQLEQVAKLGLGQPVDMETLARREIDHPLAIEPVETVADRRSEEHTSELQSLMRNSYAVFCLKKKNTHSHIIHI